MTRQLRMSARKVRRWLQKASAWLRRKTVRDVAASDTDGRDRKAKALRVLKKQLLRTQKANKKRQHGRRAADSDSGFDDDMDAGATDQTVSDDESRGSPLPSDETVSEPESGSDGDLNAGAIDQTIVRDESRGSPSPSDEIVNEPEGSDEKPVWRYRGLSRWALVQKGGKEVATNGNTGASTYKYTITVRHTDGETYDFEVRGNSLEENAHFFRAARSGRWTEADVPTVLEEDVDYFRAYLLARFYWSDFQEDLNDAVAESKGHPTDGDKVPPEVRRGREEAFEYLIGVYILADQYGDFEVANLAIDAIIDFSKQTDLLPHLGAINQAYDSTPEGSPLRLLLRDLFIHEALPGVFEANVRGGAHPDFCADTTIEWCNLKFKHMDGTIKKWFQQPVAGKPDGYYHQQLLEATPEERKVWVWGSYEELHSAGSTEMPDQDLQDAENSKARSSGP